LVRGANASLFVHLNQAIVTDGSGNPIHLSSTDQHHETRDSADAKTRRGLPVPIDIDLAHRVAGGNEPPDGWLHHSARSTPFGGKSQQNGVAIGSKRQGQYQS
jgi:hypothetical protein